MLVGVSFFLSHWAFQAGRKCNLKTYSQECNWNFGNLEEKVILNVHVLPKKASWTTNPLILHFCPSNQVCQLQIKYAELKTVKQFEVTRFFETSLQGGTSGQQKSKQLKYIAFWKKTPCSAPRIGTLPTSSSCTVQTQVRRLWTES